MPLDRSLTDWTPGDQERIDALRAVSRQRPLAQVERDELTDLRGRERDEVTRRRRIAGRLPKRGSLATRLLPNGLELVVYPLLFGRARLGIGEADDADFLDDVFEYETHTAALDAMQTWDGQGDAPGPWTRHPSSGRRRPDGTEASEFVRR